MKRLLLITMGTLLLFASCKKNNSENLPAEQLHEVKFNVGVFSQTIQDFPSKLGNANPSGGKLMLVDAPQTTPKLSDYIKKLDYFLYNSQGVKIANRSIYADTSKIGFALPTANLKAGKYTVVFVGSTGKNGSYSDLLVNGDALSSFYMINFLWSEIIDVFFQQTQFEVGNSDNYVDVTLKRPGGKLKVAIEDQWPSNVDRIGLSINGRTNYYLNGQTYQSTSSDLTIQKNYKYTYNIVNGYPMQTQTYVDCSWENFIFTNSTDVTALNGVITAYSKDNDVIVTKNLTNIRVERNKVTTVSGKLFDNLGFSTKSDFHINIDADLSGEIKQTF